MDELPIKRAQDREQWWRGQALDMSNIGEIEKITHDVWIYGQGKEIEVDLKNGMIKGNVMGYCHSFSIKMDKGEVEIIKTITNRIQTVFIGEKYRTTDYTDVWQIYTDSKVYRIDCSEDGDNEDLYEFGNAIDEFIENKCKELRIKKITNIEFQLTDLESDDKYTEW